MIVMRLSDKDHPLIYTIVGATITCSQSIWRFSFLCIIIERTIATIFFKTYERNARCLFLAVLLHVFTVGVQGISKKVQHQW
jgi:hypothetical protein